MGLVRGVGYWCRKPMIILWFFIPRRVFAGAGFCHYVVARNHTICYNMHRNTNIKIMLDNHTPHDYDCSTNCGACCAA